MSYSALTDCPESAAPQRSAKRVLSAAVTLSLALALAGCMTAKIEENRQAATKIGANEAVVLLAKPHLEGAGTENAFLDCLERELVGRKVSAEAETAHEAGKTKDPRSHLANKPFQIYADGEFVDALYPWLEPSQAPANADGLSALLARPGVGERVSAMGVRYIIWIDGATKKTDGGGSVACGAGPGGAGCIGLGWWEKQSDYQATVWDLRDKIGVGDVTTAVTGTSVFIGAIAPIPIIMPVQNTACDRMAAQLKSFLVGEGQDASN
ncbi:MAG: hypothetical protein ABL964_15660 [Steroidobacteraceae bacterium]